MSIALLVGFILMFVLVCVYLHNMTGVVTKALHAVVRQGQKHDELRIEQYGILLLRSLADKWDSVEEKPTILELRRRWHDDGPSVPSLWLRQQADQIEEGLKK